MPLIHEIEGFADVCQVILWCFAVWSVAQALFRSFPAAELRARLGGNSHRHREMQQLMWELRHRRAYTGPRDPSVAPPAELSAAELEDRARRLKRLQRLTLPSRAVNYLWTCTFCQNAWSSLLLAVCLTQGAHFIGDVLPTVLMYAGVTTVATERASMPGHARHAAGTTPCPSGNCGQQRSA